MTDGNSGVAVASANQAPSDITLFIESVAKGLEAQDTDKVAPELFSPEETKRIVDTMTASIAASPSPEAQHQKNQAEPQKQQLTAVQTTEGASKDKQTKQESIKEQSIEEKYAALLKGFNEKARKAAELGKEIDSIKSKAEKWLAFEKEATEGGYSQEVLDAAYKAFYDTLGATPSSVKEAVTQETKPKAEEVEPTSDLEALKQEALTAFSEIKKIDPNVSSQELASIVELAESLGLDYLKAYKLSDRYQQRMVEIGRELEKQETQKLKKALSAPAPDNALSLNDPNLTADQRMKIAERIAKEVFKQDFGVEPRSYIPLPVVERKPLPF